MPRTQTKAYHPPEPSREAAHRALDQLLDHAGRTELAVVDLATFEAVVALARQAVRLAQRGA